MPLNLAPLYAQEQEIVGSTGGTRVELLHTLDGLAGGRLRAEIWRTYPFAEAPRAHADLESRRTIGSIVLTVS